VARARSLLARKKKKLGKNIVPLSLKSKARGSDLHVGILHEGVEEIRGLNQAQARVAQRCNTGIHPNPNPSWEMYIISTRNFLIFDMFHASYE
jgi:hypothetical protein